jgi:hypothetical protein
MGLCVNLCGNKPLPGAMFAQDQDRAAAFRNPPYRALNARLGGMGGLRLPFSMVGQFSCCHMGTKVHVIFSLQVLNLAVKHAEYASIAWYELWGRVRFLGQSRRSGQNRSLPQENSVPLVDPGKWNSFSTFTGRRIPNRRSFHWGISLNRTASLSSPDCLV